MTFNPILHCDFETYSEADIREVGGSRYARDPSTEVLMLSYALDDEPVKLWVPAEGEPWPEDLQEYLADPKIEIHAFNAPFEYNIFRHVLGIDLPLERFKCVMVMAYALSFTGGLDAIGKQIGLPQDQQKLAIGKKLIQRFCKPAPSNHKATRYTTETHPEEWQSFKGYCIQDTETERFIENWINERHTMLDVEWQFWWLDQRINQKGLPIDVELATTAMQLHKQAKHRCTERMKDLTGLPNPNSTQQLMSWLIRHELPLENLQATTIDAILTKVELHPTIREVLELKRKTAMTAPTKWQAFIDKTDDDGCLRGMFQMNGASRTGREASRGINLQNLKSPPYGESMDDAMALLRMGSLEAIEALYGDPIEFLAAGIRGGICAPKDQTLLVSDYSSIESRFVGWLTDCQWINDTFARGLDTYKRMATGIFNTQYDAVTKSQRKFSKPVMLAGPYGQGAKGLVEYAENFGVKLTEDEAQQHVNVFRTNCWEIPQFWRWLETSIFSAVMDGQYAEGYRISIYTHNDFLFIVLPSGRKLAYHQPRIEQKETPWGAIKPTFTYMGTNRFTNKWCRIKAHMGLITENIVQAGSRDILRDGLLMADRWQYDIRGHVHDEIVALGNPDNLAALEQVMSVSPDWAPGLILSAEGFTAKHYTKV